MSREWKPGDLAIVTLTTGQTAPAMRSGTDRGEWYAPMRDDSPSFLVGDHLVASVRPLAVIDPEDREQVERLLNDYWQRVTSDYVLSREQKRDALQAALREFADPKPPKPVEPLGLGAVVADPADDPYVRTCPVDCPDGNACIPWTRSTWGTHHRWADMPTVRVLSEGVQS